MDPWQITIFTVAAAGAATLLMLAPGLLLAWLLARGRFRGRVLLDTLISLPLVMPPVANSGSVISVTTAPPPQAVSILPTRPAPLITGSPTLIPSLVPLLICRLWYQLDGECR